MADPKTDDAVVKNLSGLPRRRYDAVIVGAGGSGMRASLQLAEAGLSVAVLSKVFPTRSHTVAAQGGIGASLGNMSEDNWYWHMFDTVKGSDYLGDQDAIEYMCRAAPMNVVVRARAHGHAVRPQSGKRQDLPAPVRRPHRRITVPRRWRSRSLCRRGRPHWPRHAAHAVPAATCVRNTQFFVEWMALDLIRDPQDGDGRSASSALEMETGEVYLFLEAKATLLATGGSGRIFYAASTNAFINTGDGLGMAARAGLPLEDMEFYQFHPTGVYGAGVLITEGRARRGRHTC